jgi:hypothetical protein
MSNLFDLNMQPPTDGSDFNIGPQRTGTLILSHSDFILFIQVFVSYFHFE